MATHPSPLDNPAGNSKKKPLKSIIVMENDDDDSSSSEDDDLLLSETIHRLLLDRRGMSRAMVARLPRQEASPSAGGAHNNNNNNSDVESHGKEENEKPVRRHHGDAKKDDSVLINAAAAAPASLRALFPTGLFDSSDSDESLLTCLPIGHVEQVCRVSQQPSRALQIRGASTLIAQGTGLSSDDDDSSDDSSDDGFYKRDKKKSARRRGRMTEEKREPNHGDAALDGFDEVLDAKMPATQHGQTTNGVRSKTSATDALYENERQSSDESSLLSLSEKDDESNKRVASKPKPNKEPAGKLTRDYDPQVGDRVYAQWMPDEWYWGHVSGYKRNKSARQGYYSIEFEDGDALNCVPRENIRTVWEYQNEFCRPLVLEKDKNPVVGDRVYAEFSEHDGWFWGKVSNVTRNKRSRHDRYSIEFEDGDAIKDAPRSKLRTVMEYEQEFGVSPSTTSDDDDDCRTALSPREMYARRCKWCELCMKPDCGSCATCINYKRASSSHGREVCLQKMCLEIPIAQKKQPAMGLPPNWTFAFARNTKYYSSSSHAHIPGLFIYHPEYETKTFRSIEAAVANVPKLRTFNRNVVTDFYNHIGIIARGKTKGGARKKKRVPQPRIINSPSAVSQKPKAVGAGTVLSPQDLYANRCKQCELCIKQDCGACWSCRTNRKQPSCSRRAVCLQKMCLAIPDQQKEQPAKGLPPGFTFIFKRDKPPRHITKRSYTAGLFISHSSYSIKTFRSIEAAVDCIPRLRNFNPNVIADFNRHIGVQTISNAIPSRRKRSPKAAPVPLSASAEEIPHGKACMTLKDLYDASCGICENCRKDDCGQCSSCMSTGSSSRRQVCIQKMCCKVPTDQKAQRAIGLPSGWRFYFAEHVEPNGGYVNEPVPGLFIISKGGKKFRSVEAAARYMVGDRSEAVRKFYTYVGVLDRLEQNISQVVERPKKKSRTDKSAVITDYSLIGRGVCFAWTDVSGQTKLLYGHVSPCDVDEDGRVPVDNFKVIFGPQSRSDVNSTRTEGMPTVPEARIFPLPIILGGCISLEQQVGGACGSPLMGQVKNEYEFMNWVVPNWRQESTSPQSLPRLTLIVRGYRLELYVKQSTIPKAGYGVFVKCTSLTKRPDELPIVPFELKAGELIDLGVYGPFRPSDVKRRAVFFAKNFIFSHKCEEWAFDGEMDNQIDITDDVTGDIHDEAKAHILAYVNESSDMDRVCVRAEYDAEGNVHYLLGHGHQCQGSFFVPVECDDEMEIFVNYLDGYEKVRVRKGYSFLPAGDRKDELLEEIANDDVEYVKEMNASDAVNVEACVHFLAELVLKEGFDSGNTVERTLIVAAVLQRRAKRLLASRDEDGPKVNMKQVFENSLKLVSLLLPMIHNEHGELKRLHAEGNVDKFLVHTLRTYFSAHEFSKLSDMRIF